MAKVRAKFTCDSIFSEQEGKLNVHMSAVYGSEGENADFCKATPAGHLSLLVDEDTIAAQTWERGKSYYLTIEEA